MNKENCVLRNRNNVIKTNRLALVDKNGLNIVKNVNKTEPIKMSKIQAPNRALRSRTKPRLTEQFPFKTTRKKSQTKSTKHSDNVVTLSDVKYMKSVRVLLERDNEIETKVVATIIGTPVRESPRLSDVYEFKYDPKDEPKPRKAKRVKRKQPDSDTSGEEDNFMKDVMKKLRRKAKPLLKKTQTIRMESKKHGAVIKTVHKPVQSHLKPAQISNRINSELKLCTKPAKALKETARTQTNPNDNFQDDSADLAADFDFETESSYSHPILNIPYDPLFNKAPSNLTSKPTHNTFDALLNETPQNPITQIPSIQTSKPTQNKPNALLNETPQTPITQLSSNLTSKPTQNTLVNATPQNPLTQLPSKPAQNKPDALLNETPITQPLEVLSPISCPPKSDRFKSAKDLIQEVADSFYEDDYCKSPIKIHSNVLLKSPHATDFFNSTMVANHTPLASPWRLNISNIRKNPYCFTVKRTSFTPAYDHDPCSTNTRSKPHVYPNIVNESNSAIHSITELNPKHNSVRNNHISFDPTSKTANNTQSTCVSKHPTSEFTKVTSKTLTSDVAKSSESVQKTHQSSILSFLKFSKPQISPAKSRRQIGLFDDPLPDRSGRRVLGDHNPQTTTLNSNSSADHSNNKSSDDSMFGFSYLSDDEELNKENLGVSKRKPTRISLREIKKTFEAPPKVDAVDDDLIAEFEKPFEETDTVDSNVGLFQDCEPLEVSKKIIRHYTRKHNKRKRLVSEGSNHSDDESDHETQPAKKPKQRNLQTKKEEEESNRLANFYNSMFDEIAQHHLVIE